MAQLNVVYYPDPVLTTPASPVEVVDETIATLIDDMAETMYVEGGIGLAAPQVGESLRILVMDCSDPETGEPGLIAFVNPEILQREGTIVWDEGCLSFPGLTVEVERAERVRVRALDHEGAPFEVELMGLPAVCLQHENDHLDGLTILDRVSGLRKQRAIARWNQLKDELDAQLAEAAG